SVREYNVQVRSFPSNLTAKRLHMVPKANFTVEDEHAISTAPTVDFNAPAASPNPSVQPPAPKAPAESGASH
ncbi:MAG: LemA family protein, partial [Fibrobacteria bacterium]